MVDNLDDFGEYPKIILDQLPMGISIQDLNYTIQYENKAAIEMFGSFKGKNCYTRWDYTGNRGKCEDCPSNIALLDKKGHSIIRRMKDRSGKDMTIEINHIPLLDNDNNIVKFIEIIKDITTTEELKILDSDVRDDLFKEIYFGITSFASHGGQLHLTDPLPMIDEDIKNFYTKVSMFWFTAIGQGDGWCLGMYGPLPLLNYDDYTSTVYSFRKKTKSDIDPRLGGVDLVMLIIITRKENDIFLSHRLEYATLIRKFFDGIEFLEDLTSNSLNNLKENLL
jgi:hypothetical protein